MKSILSLTALAGTLAALALPGGAAELEVSNSWTSGGEAAAKQVIIDAFAKTGNSWKDASVAGFENEQAAYVSRLAAGDPPGAKMSIAGAETGELARQGLLLPLDDVYKKIGAAESIPASVMKAMTFDGHVYNAPISVGGESWYFYSKPVFAAAGIDAEPKDWDAFFADLDKIKAAGKTPIAWSGQGWQVYKVFNAVLLSEVGYEAFNRLMQDKDESVVRSPEFARALDVFKRLRDYVGDGSEGRNWNDATAMVIRGDAGLQFQGDWAKGEFTAAGLVAGKDYGCAVAPGSDGMVIIVDSFSFPKLKDPSAEAAQKALAETVLDPAVEAKFSMLKGSFPIRTDADASGFDICSQQAMKVMAEDHVAPEHAMVLSPAVAGAMTDLISEFWAQPWDDKKFAADFYDTLNG